MLSFDSVYVWRVRLDDPPSYSSFQMALWRRMLSVEELTRAERFRSEEHRSDYIRAHAALRAVLGNCLGISPASVRFVSDSIDGNVAHGNGSASTKPALMMTSNQPNHPDVRFNLSHTKGAALIGVALGLELG